MTEPGLVDWTLARRIAVGLAGAIVAAVSITLAAKTGSVVAVLATVGVFVALAILLALVGSALSAIYTAAVYRYAAEGDAGTTFEPELIRSAFRSK